MKTALIAIALAVACASPAVSFAQSSSQLTRAQVRQQLIEVEQAGYRPGDGDATRYPANLQKAEAKVAAQKAAERAAYGGNADGSSASAAGAEH
jgi:hypothetical protein